MRFQLISGLSCAALSYRARFILWLAPRGGPYGRRQPCSAAGPAHPGCDRRTDAAGAINAASAAEGRPGTGAGSPSSRARAGRSSSIGRARRRSPLAGRTARSRRRSRSQAGRAGRFPGNKADRPRASRRPPGSNAARTRASRRLRDCEAERSQACGKSRARGSCQGPIFLAATDAGQQCRAETSSANKSTGIASGFEQRLDRPNRGNGAVRSHF
jgi:hypothetical protein